MTVRQASMALVALLLVAAIAAYPHVREFVLETRCHSAGGVPLWEASSPTDDRADGWLRFHCERR